jgi:molybdate transport system substrate-binding protein
MKIVGIKLKLFFLLGLVVPVLWGAPAAAGQELLVSAGAGLSNALKEVAAAFEASHPGIKIVYNFAASGVLLQQMDKGAPVDVLAVADQQTMNQAQEKGLIIPASRTNFVSNQLVLIVPRDARLLVGGLNDLAGAEVKRIAVGNPAFVPVGRYTKEALERAGSWDRLGPKFILGETTRQVLDYVSRGEVDTGFVYASDVVVARGKVRVVQTVTEHAPIIFPMAVTASSDQEALARSFLNFVMSPTAQEIFQQYGFGEP